MPDAVAEPLRDYTRLTRAEISALVQLHKAGKTQVEIAQALSCSQRTVSQWLMTFEDTRDVARFTANAGAEKLVKRVLRDANVEESLEVLDRIDVLPKRQLETGRAGQVNILIGMPGLPAGTTPALSLSPPAISSLSPQTVTVSD